jgi:Predicted nucleotidyltransferases
MAEYESIKPFVLASLEAHISEIRERFGIESLSLFGSVARGEDTPESDIDLLYIFRPGETTLEHLEDLQTYLETLFDRDIDLIAKKWLNPFFRSTVLNEAVSI